MAVPVLLHSVRSKPWNSLSCDRCAFCARSTSVLTEATRVDSNRDAHASSCFCSRDANTSAASALACFHAFSTWAFSALALSALAFSALAFPCATSFSMPASSAASLCLLRETVSSTPEAGGAASWAARPRTSTAKVSNRALTLLKSSVDSLFMAPCTEAVRLATSSFRAANATSGEVVALDDVTSARVRSE